MSTLQGNTVVLDLTFHSMSDTRQGSLANVDIDADKDSVTLQKKFIRSDNYDELYKIETRVKDFVTKLALPGTPFKRGTYLLPLKVLTEVYTKLNEELVVYNKTADDLADEWDLIVEDAKKRLRTQFNPKNYPSKDVVRAKFGMTWKLLDFNVPDKALIGEVLYEEEAAKAKESWDETTREIAQALREGAQALIVRLRDQLGTNAKGEKCRVTTAAVRDINEFLDTFGKRNVLGDSELEGLVNKAKAVINGRDVESIRDNRPSIKQGLSEVAEKLDGLITTTSRAFDFD